MKLHHLLSLQMLSREEVYELLHHAISLKESRLKGTQHQYLQGKTIAFIFSKSSTRTRVSFQVGINELGGNSIFMSKRDLQLNRGESINDTAKVLSRYVHGVIMRIHYHENIVKYAQHSTVPVINALTDSFHPCQLLADLMTIFEQKKRLEGIKIAYVGDGNNNMANSWIIAAGLMGMKLCIGAPKAFHPDRILLHKFLKMDNIRVEENPKKAVEGADIIYTDVWTSMGFEKEKEDRMQKLIPYQVNQELLENAHSEVNVMHCLPAHRGEEITSDVIDGKKSIVWDQAENRLHIQKAILAKYIC